MEMSKGENPQRPSVRRMPCVSCPASEGLTSRGGPRPGSGGESEPKRWRSLFAQGGSRQNKRSDWFKLGKHEGRIKDPSFSRESTSVG